MAMIRYIIQKKEWEDVVSGRKKQDKNKEENDACVKIPRHFSKGVN